MTSRFARLGLSVFLAALICDAAAQAPAQPTPLPTNPPQAQPAQPAAAVTPTDDPLVTLKLPDADIDTILTALEIYTGRTVLRPGTLPVGSANFNLKIDDPIPRSQAILAIETVLALNNIGVSPQGDRFLIVSQLPMTRTTAPEIITGSAFSQPPSGKIAMKVFQLEFLRANEFQPIVQHILNPNAGGPIPLQNANAVMIIDSVSNLQRVETLIEQLDRPITAGMQPKFYQLNEARASDLVQKLRTILSGTLQTQLGSATSYQADDRTNQIILVTDPRQYAFFDELIEKLDIRADPNTRNDVIRLNHSKAADLVSVLTRVITGQTQAAQRQNGGSTRPGQIQQPNPLQPQQPGQPPTPGQPVVNEAAVAAAIEGFGSGSAEFSPLMTVAPDERSNSVVVSGTANDLRLIRELIAKLDVVLAQVRIEVVIAEVTLTDNHQSGISQLGLKVDGDKLVGFSGSGPSFAVGGPDGSDGSFATITRPGTSGGWDLAGTIFIGETPRKDNSVILSRPTITTSHAKEATVFVGETRPIISGSVNGGQFGGTTSTTTQQQIGINLKVTPLIGANGSVQLDVQQDVDEVGPDVIIDGNPVPIIFKRTTASFVSVKSGEIVVLGGLQRQRNARSSNRLGPIPILGDIFGSRRRNKSRTELIFFLRPHILTNTPADNESAFKQIDQLPQRDEIRRQIDPNFAPAEKESVLDRILPN